MSQATRSAPSRSTASGGVWSASEHERFLEAMRLFPQGPWRVITEFIGTRSIKQVQTHAQKYQQKLLRHQRGLRKRKNKSSRHEHRLDEITREQFINGHIVRQSAIFPVTALSPRSPSGDVDAHSSNLLKTQLPQTMTAPSLPAFHPRPTYYEEMPPHSTFTHIEPLPFRHVQPAQARDWNEPDLQVLMETLEIVMY
ncbi:hypothetical protein Poli38472_004742 [Pythium oligandrum]|uniref:Uncharacterized protein n=1 Tax=Pythium oligandrum TaxID=41045 RepID=A0A8K1CB00_PYTOL|nr:hypothetical protein Poli38472_004742 [Pythium oligandrum]|eukprot:TMW59673.1 hypothetical protein Poli38472_004742 [Pythium oligandrum]